MFIFVSVGDVARMVHNNVASKDPNICYAAKLLGMQGEKFSKPKKVVCFISPKQLTIKEYLLRIIPKRLVTFRLCPSTKVSKDSRERNISLFIYRLYVLFSIYIEHV